MNSLSVLAIGALAQVFFSARVLVQWVLSERAHKVLSPSVFWVFSLAGAYLLCVYGWLRHDFAIVMGQFVSYYVYLWNLKQKGVLARLPLVARRLLAFTPPVVLLLVANNASAFVQEFFSDSGIPLWLVLFGSFGQVLFTFRFVYQYVYSRRRRVSALPRGFWIISLAGSASICAYGLLRHDLVLIVGQSFGIVAYVRNLWIGHEAKKEVL